MSYQQPPGREADRYQDQSDRAPHRRYGAYGSQQTQAPPGTWQEPQFPYQPRQPYGQPRQPSYTPDPQYGPPPGRPLYKRQPHYPPQSYGQDPYQQRQPHYGRQPYPPQGYRQGSYQEAPRKRRRVFLWVFLGIQALFIAWIIAGIASKPGGTPVAQQAAEQCANGGWQGLFKSYADCTTHYAVALNDATDARKGIGVAVIVAVWFVVDVILGISYGIYKLARRAA